MPEVAVDAAEDVAVLPYSSGTTGLPKGVMLTHANIGVNLRQIAALRPMAPDDRIIAVLPFFHIYGMTVLMNLPLQAGATVVVMPRFDLESSSASSSEHRITVRSWCRRSSLGARQAPGGRPARSLGAHHIISGAAPLGAELAERARTGSACSSAGLRDDRD